MAVFQPDFAGTDPTLHTDGQVRIALESDQNGGGNERSGPAALGRQPGQPGLVLG